VDPEEAAQALAKSAALDPEEAAASLAKSNGMDPTDAEAALAKSSPPNAADQSSATAAEGFRSIDTSKGLTAAKRFFEQMKAIPDPSVQASLITRAGPWLDVAMSLAPYSMFRAKMEERKGRLPPKGESDPNKRQRYEAIASGLDPRIAEHYYPVDQRTAGGFDTLPEDAADAVNKGLATVSWPGQKFFQALDYVTARPVRAATAYAFSDRSPSEAWNMPPEDWSAAVVKTAETPPGTHGVPNDDRSWEKYNAARFGTGVQKQIGESLGRIAGAGMGFASGLTFDAPGLIANYTGINPLRVVPQTFGDWYANTTANANEMGEIGKNVGVQVGTDPLALFGRFGEHPGSINAARTVLDATGNKALAVDIGNMMREHAGTARQVPEAQRIFSEFGVPTIEQEAMLGGPGLPFLGAPQATLGLPFLHSDPRMTVPLDTQYRLRGALQSIPGVPGAVDAAAKFIGANPVYNRQWEFANALRRAAIGQEARIGKSLEQQTLDDLHRSLPPTDYNQESGLGDFRARFAGDPATGAEYLRRVMEPDIISRTRPPAQLDLFGNGAPAVGGGEFSFRPKPEIEVPTPLYDTTGQGVLRRDIGEPGVTEPWQYTFQKTKDYGSTFEPEVTSQPAPLPAWTEDAARRKYVPDAKMEQALAAERKLAEDIQKAHGNETDPAKQRAALAKAMPDLPQRLAEVARLRREGSFHALTAAPDYVPASEANRVFGAGAKEMLDVAKRDADRWHQNLAANTGIGFLGENQKAANPFSGVYTHRDMEARYGLMDELAMRRKGGGSAGANDLGMGRLGAESDLPGGLFRSEMPDYMGEATQDPIERIAQLNQLGRRAYGETWLWQQAAKDFGTPVEKAASDLNLGVGERDVRMPDGSVQRFRFEPEVFNLFNRAFAPNAGRLGRVLTANIDPTTPTARALIAGGKAYDWLGNRFKALALMRPGYHSTNWANDTVGDFLNGNPSPVAYQRAALHMDPVEAAKAQAAGLPIDSGMERRFEMDPTQTMARAMQQEILPDSTAKKVASLVWPSEFGGTPVSRAIGETIERSQKGASYLFERAKGASPAEAVNRALQLKIDYQYRRPEEGALSLLAPFAKYASEAPRRVVRMGLQNPGRMMVLDRMLNGLDERKDLEPRQDVQDTGRFLRLGGQRARIAGQAMADFAGAAGLMNPSSPYNDTNPVGIPPGYDPAIVLKADQYDPFAPMQSWDNALGTLSPLLRAGIEQATERDLVGHKPMSRAHSTTGLPLFPHDSAAPSWLQADEGSTPLASRYLPPYALSSMLQLGVNGYEGLDRIGAPTATLGAQRPYFPATPTADGMIDPRTTYAAQLFSSLFPGRIFGITPADPIQNFANSPEVRGVLANEKAAQNQEDFLRMWQAYRERAGQPRPMFDPQFLEAVRSAIRRPASP